MKILTDNNGKPYIDESGKALNGGTVLDAYTKAEADTKFVQKDGSKVLSDNNFSDNYKNKLDDIILPIIVKDTASTSVTLTANGNYSYIYGTLTSLNLAFATGTDDATFHIIYKSGSTATTMTISATNAIFDSFAPSANAIVEIDGMWYLDKWIVFFKETKVSV